MLELSLVSTQCTHGAAVKLFAGNLVLVDLSQSSIHRCIVDLGMGEPK
jgi:hypothetical protein